MSEHKDILKIYDIVRIEPSGDAAFDQRFGGCFAVVLAFEGSERALVDSDAYVRRTGKSQSRSFREWLPVSSMTFIEGEDWA